ncbi:hypothetical protein PS2_022069 [Malus domestica]
MQSLASICEALLPPLYETDKVEQLTTNKTVQSFYKASAAQTPIPDEVAQLLIRRALIEAVVLVRVVLWVLGTKLGTLLLGSLCFGNTPSFTNFQVCRWRKEKRYCRSGSGTGFSHQ